MNHPIEAEEGILACCLLDENNIDVVAQSLESDALSDIRIAALWRLMLEMRNDGKPVDSITLISRVREANMEHECGGIHYIGELEKRVSSAINLPYYIEVVKEAYAHRHGLEALSEASLGLSGDLTAEQVFARLETTTESLKEKHTRGRKRTRIDALQQIIEECQEAHDGKVPAIKTHFPNLDRALGGGLWPAELIVVGARPSMGKSTLAKDIALNMGLNADPATVFSLEDIDTIFYRRALASHAKVPFNLIRSGFKDDNGKYHDRAHAKVLSSMERIRDCSLEVDDESPLTISQLVSKMNEHKRKHGTKAFFVDYLQYLSPDISKDKRDQEVAQISKALKSAAKRLNVPIVALAQLNRDTDNLKPGVHPIEKNLGESAAIERDADVILMLHKDHDFSEEDTEIWKINCHVLKQRNGPKHVNVPLLMHRSTVHFEERTRNDDLDWIGN